MIPDTSSYYTAEAAILNNRILRYAKAFTCDAPSSKNETLQKVQFQILIKRYKEILEKEEVMPIHLSSILCCSIKKAVETGLTKYMQEECWGFVESVLVAMTGRIIEFMPRWLTNTIWVLGKLGPDVKNKILKIGNKEITLAMTIDQILNTTKLKIKYFNSKDISKLMLGLAWLNHLAPFDILAAVMKRAIFIKKSFNSQEAANLMWAAATLGLIEDGRDLAACFIKEMSILKKSFTPQGLSNFLWSCAKLRVKMSVEALTEFDQVLCDKFAKWNSQDISNTLWSFAKLYYFPSTNFFKKTEIYFLKKSESFKTQEMANCLYAFAIFHKVPESLIQIAKSHLDRHAPEFTLQEHCNSVWALSMLDSLDLHFFSAVAQRLFREDITNQCDKDLRQLYHCFLHLDKIKKQTVSLPEPLQSLCEDSWVSHHASSPINYMVSQVLERLDQAEVQMKSPYFVQELGITVNMVIFKNQRIAVEVVRLTSCFVNERHRLQGPDRWRHKLLRATGWRVVIIYEYIWTRLGYVQQNTYLEEKFPDIL